MQLAQLALARSRLFLRFSQVSPIAFRRFEEVALGALFRRVVVNTRRMTSQTERAGGCQDVHGFRFMALAAAGMRMDRTSVSLDDLPSLVTVGTGARATFNGFVVLGVAGDTGHDLGFRLQAHRFGMALHTYHLSVRCVFEPNPTSSWLMVRDRYLHGHFFGADKLARFVAGAALGTSWALMVAYLTSPRRLEGQVAAARGRGVAGNAGELAMALM